MVWVYNSKCLQIFYSLFKIYKQLAKTRYDFKLYTIMLCLYRWNPYHGLYTNFDYRSLSTTGFLIVQIAFAEQPLAASDVQYFWMRLRTYGYMKCFIFLSTANKIKSRLVYSSLYSVLHFWLLWHWCIPQTSFHSLKLKVKSGMTMRLLSAETKWRKSLRT